jgi:lysophospholipid acyltransferase (LPLAT)-like uncharacterized protein
LIRAAAGGIALVLRAWMATVRCHVAAADGQTHPVDPRRQRFIYAFWHESVLALTKVKTNVKVLISQSRDGELIAQVCRYLGIGVVRGSSTRGGAAALLELLRTNEGHLAITPDGPRGPRRRVQGGLVFLAARTGLPILPVGVGFVRAWRARSWDRTAVPCPFSSVAAVIGPPLLVPAQIKESHLKESEWEEHRLWVESAMLAATAAAEHWASELAVRGNASATVARFPLNTPARFPRDAVDLPPGLPLVPSAASDPITFINQ